MSDIAALIESCRKHKAEQFKDRVRNLDINRKEGLYIQYRIKLSGHTCADIAQELNVDKSLISLVLSGVRHSVRAEAAIAEFLGFSSWNDMIQDVRRRVA